MLLLLLSCRGSSSFATAPTVEKTTRPPPYCMQYSFIHPKTSLAYDQINTIFIYYTKQILYGGQRHTSLFSLIVCNVFISALRFKGFVLPMSQKGRLQLQRSLQPWFAGRRLHTRAGCIFISTHLFTSIFTTTAKGSLQRSPKHKM